MRRYAILAFCVTALLVVPPGAAQTDTDGGSGDIDCSSPTRALEWWMDQEDRVDASPPSVQEFWRSLQPALQVKREISDPAPLCQVLDHLLRASRADADPVDASQELIDASEPAGQLSSDLAVFAEPPMRSVARQVGQELRTRIDATDRTPNRIELLEQSQTMYGAVGLDGARARISLWLETDRTTWQLDQQRTDRHLNQTDETLEEINASILSPLELGAMPGLVESLETDRSIMADHLAVEEGAEDPPARIQSIDAAVTQLRAAQSRALVSNLAGTFGIVVVTIAVVLVIRIPLRSLERDVRDLETTLGGIPV